MASGRGPTADGMGSEYRAILSVSASFVEHTCIHSTAQTHPGTYVSRSA